MLDPYDNLNIILDIYYYDNNNEFSIIVTTQPYLFTPEMYMCQCLQLKMVTKLIHTLLNTSFHLFNSLFHLPLNLLFQIKCNVSKFNLYREHRVKVLHYCCYNHDIDAYYQDEGFATITQASYTNVQYCATHTVVQVSI